MQRIGILGGGQLGRMLLQAAVNYPVETFLMESDPGCPAAHLSHHFRRGDITSFDDVYNFGRQLDAITIEIESVNAEALQQLEESGVRVYPRPGALRIIRNKILQKQFYRQHNIPSAAFHITGKQSDLHGYHEFFPAIHKLAEGGYDGRGVVTIKASNDIHLGFNEPAVLEKMIRIAKEISVIIAVSDAGELAVYPLVEMIFDPELNQLDYQLSPARIDQHLADEMKNMAVSVVKNLESPGIFAVEMFLDEEGKAWVNETAPRVHNSGHHTIEANYSSQFDMLWRVMLGYPSGNTDHILPAAMINITGAPGANGEARYEGIEEVLSMENAFVHLYGKRETRPGRKMGHVTIINDDMNMLVEDAQRVKQLVRVNNN